MTGMPEKSLILVVDDEPGDAALARVVLEGAGYAVDVVTSGEAALERFTVRTPTVVLLDLRMPGIDGCETCRRLRALPGGSEVPILFLTAHSEPSEYENAVNAGADDFLMKPMGRTELLVRVRSLTRIGNLSKELRGNYETIRAQRDELVAEEARRRELTDLIVHDLKSPLSVILANVEYTLTRPGIVAEAWEALHDVVGSVQNMLGMILNLLDVSRSRDGKLVPSLGPVDVRALSEEVSGTWRRRAEGDGRTVRVEGTLTPALVYADVDLLRRVLENLLDNALRHTPKGTNVTLVLAPEPTLVRISVKDEGGGIPADARARIFEKYGRLGALDSQGTRSGRGLGLVFCRLAVEAHGGRIWVEDNVPKGAVFVFEVPVGAPPLST